MRNSLRITFIVLILTAFSLSSVAFPTLPDVEEHWAEENIRELVEMGAIEGYPDGTFKPEDTITRAEFCTILGKALEIEEGISGATFSDLEETDHWGTGLIEGLVNEGIINADYYGNNYNPGENITREEIAMMMARSMENTGGDIQEELPFHDIEDITPGFEHYINSAYGKDIIEGYPDNTFKPREAATRGEASAMTVRTLVYLGLIEEKVDDISLAVEMTPEFVPEGGGSTVSFRVAVRDNLGNPFEGATVHVNSNTLDNESRNLQLSATELLTDYNGEAEVHYDTMALDDNIQVNVEFAVNFEGIWADVNMPVIASNEGVKVEGTVANPFTGEPCPNISIDFESQDNNATYNTNADSNGEYSMILPKGHYHFKFFDINIDHAPISITQNYEGTHFDLSFDSLKWSSIPVDMDEPGAYYTVNHNKGVLKGIITDANPGENLVLLPTSSKEPYDYQAVMVDLAPDGSFIAPLMEGVYDISLIGGIEPFVYGVSVEGGTIRDLGSIESR